VSSVGYSNEFKLFHPAQIDAIQIQISFVFEWVGFRFRRPPASHPIQSNKGEQRAHQSQHMTRDMHHQTQEIRNMNLKSPALSCI